MTDSNKRRRRTSEPLYTKVFDIQDVSPKTLTVDFIGKNVFWSEKHSINVASLDGSFKKSLIQRADQSIEILGMTIDPIKGYVENYTLVSLFGSQESREGWVD